ncbi:MAG: hypothetical protein AB7I50_10500 [Vicinamibacterales bacterium]
MPNSSKSIAGSGGQPSYDEEHVERALHRLLLGDELMREVWPERELVEP